MLPAGATRRKRTRAEYEHFLREEPSWSAIEADERQRALERRFGPPPYAFLDVADDGVPYRSATRRRSNTIDPKRRARNPQPNYSAFGAAEFVDADGREYRVASGWAEQRMVRAGEIERPHFVTPALETPEHIGTQLLWVRVPIHTRGNVLPPDAQGERLDLYHIATQVRCTCTTDGSFFGRRRKTGYVVARDFRTHGQVVDPGAYRHLVERDLMPEWRRHAL